MVENSPFDGTQFRVMEEPKVDHQEWSTQSRTEKGRSIVQFTKYATHDHRYKPIERITNEVLTN